MIARSPRSVAPLVTIPKHVAIIMDGNRRWAHAQGLGPLAGHRRGVRALQQTIAAALAHGISVLTIFAFSEENWCRGQSEVGPLLALVARIAKRECKSLARAGIRVRIIGRTDRLPTATRTALADLEAATLAATDLILNIAIDYSARREMAEAVRSLARDVASGSLEPSAIDEPAIAARLTTGGLPDPDLIIRTGGELRLSNFLLYQSAYAELWATPTPWPDFTRPVFEEALLAFSQRQRRFGR